MTDQPKPILAMTAWQPIETAPKDGTFILGTMGGKIPFVMAWCGDLAEETGSGWFTFNQYYETTTQRRGGKPWRPVGWQPIEPFDLAALEGGEG